MVEGDTTAAGPCIPHKSAEKVMISCCAFYNFKAKRAPLRSLSCGLCLFCHTKPSGATSAPKVAAGSHGSLDRCMAPPGLPRSDQIYPVGGSVTQTQAGEVERAGVEAAGPQLYILLLSTWKLSSTKLRASDGLVTQKELILPVYSNYLPRRGLSAGHPVLAAYLERQGHT